MILRREKNLGAAFIEAAVALAVGLPLLVSAGIYSYGIYSRSTIREVLDSGLHDFSISAFNIEKTGGTFKLVPREIQIENSVQKLNQFLTDKIQKETGILATNLYTEACAVLVEVDASSGSASSVSKMICKENGNRGLAPSESVPSLIASTNHKPGIPNPVGGYYNLGVMIVTRSGAKLFPEWVSGDLPLPSFISESKLYVPHTEVSL